MALSFAEFKTKKTPDPTTESKTPTFGEFKASRAPVTDVMTGSFVQPATTGFLNHAARNNNPGNLKFAGQPGAFKAPDSDFARFPTIQAGFAAMKRDVLAKMDGKSTAEAAKKINLGPNSTIYDLISVYAPPHENRTMDYATTVASRLGVTVDTKVRDVRDRIDEFAKAMVFVEDKDAYAMLTGARTANAQGPATQAPTTQAQPATPPKASSGSFADFKQKKDAQGAFGMASLERGYNTDVFGTGFVFTSKAKEVDPTLVTPDQMSDTANSTPMFITPEQKDEKRILPKPIGDARDIMLSSMIGDTYTSIMNTLFTGVRAATENAVATKGPWEEGSSMAKFDKWLDDKVNIPLSEHSKKQIELAGGLMTSNAMRWSDGKEGISSWRETLYSWGNTFGSMGTAIGLWAVTRNPNVAAGFLSAIESSNVYNEARDAGKSPQDAFGVAATSGVGTFLLEKWGITVMGGLAGSKTLTQWVINGAKAGLAETGQEELQTVWQNVVKKYGYDESQKWFEGVFDTAIATFVPSMLMNMALPSATSVIGRSDILKEIQDKAGVDQDTADRAWQVMRYATTDMFNSLRVRGLQIEDVSGGKPSRLQDDFIPQGSNQDVGSIKRNVTTDFESIAKQLGDETFKVVDVEVIGSRARQSAREDSDFDIVVQYSGKLDEGLVSDFVRDHNFETGEPVHGRGEMGYGNLYTDITAIKTPIDEYLQQDKEIQDKKTTEVDPFSPEAIDQIFEDFRKADEAEKVKEDTRKEDEEEETAAVDAAISSLEVSDEIAAPILEQAREAYKKAEQDILLIMETSEKGERIASYQADSYDLKFTAKNSTFPSWMPEDLRSTKLFEQAMNYWRTGTQPKANATRVNRLLDEMAQYIYSRMGPELATEYAYQEVVQAEADAQTAVSRARQDFKDRIKRILKGEEKPGKLTSGQVSKVLKESKSVEQRAASRQVAFEKREARRKLVKQRVEIVTALRAREQTLAELRERVRAYAKAALPKNISKSAYDSIATRIARTKTELGLERAMLHIEHQQELARKKGLRTELAKVWKKVKKDPSGISPEYRKAIRDYLKQYDFKQEGPKHKTPEGKIPYDQITANDMQRILLTVKDLEAMGRKATAERLAVYEAKKAYWTEQLQEQGGKTLEYLADQNAEANAEDLRKGLTVNQWLTDKVLRFRDKLKGGLFAWTPEMVILDTLDGMKATYDGVNMRLFHNEYVNGWRRYKNEFDIETKAVVDKAIEYGLEKGNFRVMGIVAAREQKGGYEKLENAGYSKEVVDAIVLTKEEQEVLDMMRDTMDKYFPLLQRIMKDMYNKEVEKVDYYFPWLTDYSKLHEHSIADRFDADIIAKSMYTDPTHKTKTPNTKMTISRTGPGDQKIKVDAMEIFTKHMDDVIYLVEVGEHLKLAGEIANSKEYKEVAGARGQFLVQNYVDTLARKGGASGLAQAKWIDVPRKNVSAFVMGYKLSTILVQPSAYIDAMAFVGPGNLVWGASEFTTSKEARDFILTKFPQVRDRAGGEQAVRDLMEGSWWDKKMSYGYMPMQFVDKITAASVALSAYRQYAKANGIEVDYNKAPDPKGVEFAENVMTRSQASTLYHETPQALSRGGFTGNRSLDRAIGQFQTFAMNRASIFLYDGIMSGYHTGNYGRTARITASLFGASMYSTATRMGLLALMYALFGDEDDEPTEERLVDYAVYELMGIVPFSSNLYGWYKYDNGLFPVLDVWDGLPDDARAAFESKNPETRARAWARLSLTLMGAGAGVPGTLQAQQILMKTMPEADQKKKTTKSKVFGGGESKVFGGGGSSKKVFGNSSKVFGN